MTHSFYAARAAILGMSMIAASSSVVAQSEQNTTISNLDNTLEEVVVTARRRNESAQDVPVSLTALTGNDLRKNSIFEPSDLQSHVPSLIVAQDINGGNAQPIFTIRGLGQEYQTEPTVLVYFADAPAESRLVGNTLYDLGSVQVLRGPQGTLFGKNAIGGAVLLEPQMPTDLQEGFVQARFGNFDTRDYTVMLNTPLADWAAVRIAGESIRADGWLKNIDGPDLNNRHHDSARLSLLLKPTNWLESSTLLQFFDLNQRSTGGQLTAFVPCPTFRGNCFYSPPLTTFTGEPSIAAAFALQQQLGPRSVALTNPGIDQIIDRRVTNSTTATFDSITLKNIASFSSASVLGEKNLTGTNVPVFLTDINDSISNGSDELQLQGKSLADQVKWIFGGFYNNSTDYSTSYANVFVSPLNRSNPALHLADDGSRSKAIFAQTTISFSHWIPGLDFTGGYRKTWDTRDESLYATSNKKCALQYPNGTPLAGQFFPYTNKACSRLTTADFSANGYTYGFDYKVNDSIMVFISRNAAYKAGGFNQLVVQPSLYSYQPEYIVDTELGLKSDLRLFNRPLRVNLSLYDSHFTNIQLEDVNTDPLTGISQSFVFNGSKASMHGGELEVTYLPIDALELDANYTYNDGKYDSLISLATGSAVTFSGRPFSFLPRSTYRLATTWYLPIPVAFARTSLTVDYYHQDNVPGYATRPAGSLNETAPYGIGNARLNLQGVSGFPVDLSLYVKNLQNRLYQVYALDDSQVLGFSSDAYGEPRTFGLTMEWRFGTGSRR